MRLLYNDYKAWCATNNIELSYQVSTLLPSMLGDDKHPFVKTKAAETGVLLRWATAFCGKECDKLQGGAMLHAAGDAIVSYISLLRTSEFYVPWDTCQTLLDLCLRHLHLMGELGFSFLPKSHMWVHMTCNIPAHGNPRFYSTFVDESLNLVIARMAAASHRSTWEESIFLRVRLLPHLLHNSVLARV